VIPAFAVEGRQTRRQRSRGRLHPVGGRRSVLEVVSREQPVRLDAAVDRQGVGPERARRTRGHGGQALGAGPRRSAEQEVTAEETGRTGEGAKSHVNSPVYHVTT